MGPKLDESDFARAEAAWLMSPWEKEWHTDECDNGAEVCKCAEIRQEASDMAAEAKYDQEKEEGI